MSLLSRKETHTHTPHLDQEVFSGQLGKSEELQKGKTILKVENFSVKRGNETVIRDLDLEVEHGEILAILGPNGSGKTSFLRGLLGILSFSGQVSWWSGLRINYLPEDLSPQKFREIPITVKEFFQLKDVSLEEVANILKSVGIYKEGILSRNPGQLSGGQFQRLVVAWSLVDKPDVLIFDEPTTSIDVGGEETIYSLIKEFAEKRVMTVILVTHEVDVVYGLATNVLCLREKKVCYGPPGDALDSNTLNELYGSSVNLHKHSKD
ncbi:MAG: metal ABC transporter ATP-binding protein [Candidatus Magasanikbacteria bacterium]